MKKERLEYLSHLFICIAGIAVAVYLGFSLLLPLTLPFLIAWGIAFATRPICARLGRLLRVKPKMLRPILALILLLGLLALVCFLAARLVTEAWQLLSGLGENDAFMEFIGSLVNPLEGIFGSSEGAAALEERLTEAVGELISSLLTAVGSFLTGIASSIPGILIFVLITVISSVYFSLDLEHINCAVKRRMPERAVKGIMRFKESSLKIALKYLRSYLLIMLITFAVMLLGFVILRVPYALLVALIVALLDVLPVLGVGTVLVPWSVWMLITGDLRVGIGLIILFVVNEIIRQFAEPKIVGKSLGLHPIITLVLLYAGYSLLGLAGLVLLPLFAVVINTVIVKGDASEVEKPSG